jgi:TolA-binding protein
MFLPSTLAKFTQSFPEFLLERLRVRHPYVEGAYSCWLRARREATPPPNRKPPKVISPVDRARRGPQKPTSASNCVGVAARWVGAAPGGVAMKTRRGNTTKLKRRKGATAARSRSSSATDLQKRLDQRTRERDEARKHLSVAQMHLAESLEQQTATSEVLRVISSSPGELEPVFQAMLENATRICGAEFGILLLFDGSAMRVVAMNNPPRAFAEMRRDNPVIPLEKSILGPLVRTKKTSHVADITAEEPYASSPLAKVGGARTAGARDMIASLTFDCHSSGGRWPFVVPSPVLGLSDPSQDEGKD